MKTAIVLSLLVGVILGLAINSAATDNASGIVYAECQKARTAQTVSESRCAELQDKYKIEFLCSDRNTSLNNKCWTESNPELGE